MFNHFVIFGFNIVFSYCYFLNFLYIFMWLICLLKKILFIYISAFRVMILLYIKQQVGLSFNQLINLEPVDWLINIPVGWKINRPVNWSINKQLDCSIKRPIDCSINRPVDCSIKRPVDWSTNRPVIDQPLSQLIDQTLNQLINYLVE